MNKFKRGMVIHHKVMGKGIILNDLKDDKVEVRMVNGHIEKFYPEELETEEEYKAKNKNKIMNEGNQRKSLW